MWCDLEHAPERHATRQVGRGRPLARAAPVEQPERSKEASVPPIVIGVWEVVGPPPRSEKGRLFFLEKTSPSRETFIPNDRWGSDDEGYALAVQRLTGLTLAQHRKAHRRIRIHDRNERGRLLRQYPDGWR